MQNAIMFGRRLSLAALLFLAGGCHAPGRHSAGKAKECVCTPNGPCGGYFSTCWRQWPAECAMCPPTLEPADVPPASPPLNEFIPPPAPRPQEMPPGVQPDAIDPFTPPAAASHQRSVPYNVQRTALNEPAATSTSNSNEFRPSRDAPAAAPSTASPAGPRPANRSQPPRQLRLRFPRPDDTVVLRRTTVELRSPGEPTADGSMRTSQPSPPPTRVR